MKVLKELSFSFSAAATACGIYFTYKYDNFLPSGKIPLQASEQNMKLEQVQILFRHGTRTPTSNLSVNDLPNLEEANWDAGKYMITVPCTDIDVEVRNNDGGPKPESLMDKSYVERGPMRGGCLTGTLTSVGQQQMYDFGLTVAEEYIKNRKFISPIYNKDEICVRSSNFGRTINSARSVLAGIYQKDNIKEPVLIETRPLEVEDYYPWESCHNLKYYALKAWRQFDELPGHKEDREKIWKLMSMKDTDPPIHFVALLDFMHCRRAHGFYIPQYLLDNEEMMDKRASQLQAHVLGIGNLALTRNAIGALIHTLCSRIEDAAAEKDNRKLFLYACHDNTIMSLLMVFDNWKETWPPFAANITLELYKMEDGERVIRILYNGEPLILDKETMEVYLTVQKFLDFVEKYRVTDWAKDCGNVSK